LGALNSPRSKPPAVPPGPVPPRRVGTPLENLLTHLKQGLVVGEDETQDFDLRLGHIVASMKGAAELLPEWERGVRGSIAPAKLLEAGTMLLASLFAGELKSIFAKAMTMEKNPAYFEWKQKRLGDVMRAALETGSALQGLPEAAEVATKITSMATFLVQETQMEAHVERGNKQAFMGDRAGAANSYMEALYFLRSGETQPRLREKHEPEIKAKILEVGGSVPV